VLQCWKDSIPFGIEGALAKGFGQYCSGNQWGSLEAEFRFRNYLKYMAFELEGCILDIACGPYLLGCIYDNVHGHDDTESF